MLALVLSLIAQGTGPSREAQVLELFRELDRDGAIFYSGVHFAPVQPAVGAGPAFDGEVHTTCGNSRQGSFDDARARDLVRRLGAIYGLRFEPDVERHAGLGRAVLDGFDATARVGFELRGRLRGWDLLLDEPHEDTLDEFEWRVLAGQGVRVRVDDGRRFERLDGTTFVGEVAYLSGVVAFLNEVTEGEDVELGGLRFERGEAWDPMLPRSLPAGVLRKPDEIPVWIRFEESGGERFFDGEYEVSTPACVELFCAGVAEYREPENPYRMGREGVGIVTSTRGAPSTLLVKGFAWKGDASEELPEFQLRFRQRCDGVERIHAGSPRSLVLFLPAEFDLAEPFTLELEFGPGHYRFLGVRLGASAAVRGSAR